QGKRARLMILRSLKFLSHPELPQEAAEQSPYFDATATIPGVRRALEREYNRGTQQPHRKLNQVVPADSSGQRMDSPWAWKLPLPNNLKPGAGMAFPIPVP